MRAALSLASTSPTLKRVSASSWSCRAHGPPSETLRSRQRRRCRAACAGSDSPRPRRSARISSPLPLGRSRRFRFPPRLNPLPRGARRRERGRPPKGVRVLPPRKRRPILLKDVPPEFIRVGSGLGHATPANVNILPALFEDEVKAVIELASFSEFNETHQTFLDQLMESVGIVLNTIAATMRTEGLLKQSQLLTTELQARQTELTRKQEELHATNEELQEKAQLLENEKKQVEAKNIEIEMARRAVEEKAEQLALTSKYKSEFLANMSHELRTPLNSLLILSKLLADNAQGNLNEKQVEFAKTINSAGSDLLNLINDILDLSKIESGTVTIEVGEMPMQYLKQHMERTFRQLAADKG